MQYNQSIFNVYKQGKITTLISIKITLYTILIIIYHRFIMLGKNKDNSNKKSIKNVMNL